MDFLFCNDKCVKSRTLEQAQTAKRKAEAFTRGVLHNEQRADEIASESVEDYAERKHIIIQNPKERVMVRRRRNRLTVGELETENEMLIGKVEELEIELDALRNAVSEAAELLPDDDEEDSDEEDSEDGDSDDDEEEN
jgi:hypothetical protein